MSRKKNFFKDVMLYSGSVFFSNIFNFITGIAIRHILQPALMGFFSGIMLFAEYARYSHLGILHALDKEMPYFYGKKDQKKIEELKDIGYTFCFGIALLVSVGLFVVSMFLAFSQDKVLANGIRIISCLVFFQILSSLYVILNRSRNNFSVIS